MQQGGRARTRVLRLQQSGKVVKLVKKASKAQQGGRARTRVLRLQQSSKVEKVVVKASNARNKKLLKRSKAASNASGKANSKASKARVLRQQLPHDVLILLLTNLSCCKLI